MLPSTRNEKNEEQEIYRFTQKKYLENARHICTDLRKCKETCGKMKCMFFGTPEGCLRQEIFGKPCPYAHVTAKPPPKPCEEKVREIIKAIGDTTTKLHDRHYIDQVGKECFFSYLCTLEDCRRHHCCAMKNLGIAIKIRDYHERVKEEQEASHAQKEEQVSHLPCRFRMRIQHADRKLRTLHILEEKQNRVDGLVDFLEPFINKHTTALLEHCSALLTFELVQSNQEAMTKIALLQKRIIEFKENEIWTSGELDRMRHDTYLHEIQF